jgi:hypothetical protein
MASGTRAQDEVARDLLAALQDDELTDVYLVGGDGVQVPTCRFVLAARSKVLKRMLYGSFREAKSSTICMMGYDSSVLQAVVDYCYGSDITKFRSSLGKGEPAIRKLVHLAKAADYLELPGLQQKVDRVVRSIMTKHPNLACAVFDEASPDSQLSDYALQIIECRPYVALQSSQDESAAGGGIECLRSDGLISIMNSARIEAGELYLFRMLRRWFDHTVAANCQDSALRVGYECSNYITLEDIEPRELFNQVQDCHFVSPERIFDAVTKQALRASEERIWSIRCRGRASVDRVLVEGAGVRDANGIYYQITGLANGDLYSKREVTCGQQHVYTLSCNCKDDTYECRIFCSKLLTDKAVSSLETMQITSVLDPVFQPVMQIVQVSEPEQSVPTPIRKYYRVQLSDGELYMQGTLATALATLVRNDEIGENSVIKVLEFGLYQLDGHAAVHITKASIVSSNPGQCFGEPVSINEFPLAKETETYDSQSSDGHIGSLQSLYSCKYHVDLQAKDTKIPRSGWSVDDQGIGPDPTCVWIPAVAKVCAGQQLKSMKTV